MLVEITRKEKETEIQNKEADRREKELLATVNKQADADAYKISKEADAKKYSELKEAEAYSMAIKVKAEAEAEAIRIKGEAEAAAIRAKGIAEAETMEKKAEAYRLYNNAAVTQMIVEKLPEIATAVAEPLAKTEKIVIIDNGGSSDSQGAAKVSGYVTEIISQLPETIEAMTGFNFMEALKTKVSKEETEDVKTNSTEVVSDVESTEVDKTGEFKEVM